MPSIRISRAPLAVRMIAPTLLAAAAWGGDAAPTTAPIELRVADGSTLAAHWNASIYSTLWNDPALAEARTRYDEQCQELAKTIGFDPRDGLSAMTMARMALTGLDRDEDSKPRPHVLVSADFAEMAAKLFQLAAAKSKPATAAGADEAIAIEQAGQTQNGVLARFGTLLVAGLNTDAARPAPLQKAEADLRVSIDVMALLRLLKDAVPSDQTDVIDLMIENPQLYSGTYRYDATIVPEGLSETLVQTTPWPAAIPVDRDLLARLPATTLMQIAFGIDGRALWKTCKPLWMKQAAQGMSKTRDVPIDAEQAEQEINAFFTKAGLTCTIADLVEGLNGTTIFALGQGAPFPTATIAFPRSPAFDQVVGFGLQQAQAEAPPEGSSIMLPIPNLPMAVTIICDRDHWVATTDPAVTAGWTGGQRGGWADAAVGKLALAKGAPDAVMIGSSDTPAVLRTVSGYAGMVLGMQPGLDAKQKQAILQALNKLGASASTGYVVVKRAGTGTALESRGLFGFAGLPMIAIAAGAMAAPKAVKASEDMGAMTGLNELLMAEMKFQSSTYIDQDGDDIGEYGLLSELGGLRPVPGDPVVSLIPADLAAGTAGGYRYALFLPNADGGALAEPDGSDARPKDAKAADAQEGMWIAYAWPANAKTGAKMFAMTQDGQIRSATYLGEDPRWDDIFNGGGWGADPGWDPYEAP